jgi:hypothetical protein
MSAQKEAAAARPASAPTCTRCAHYYITYDITFRYGCRALGFKSRGQPCREVIAASGEPCRFFAPKPERGAAGS